MKESNSAIGSSFERQFCDLLAEEGFWVHLMAKNRAGQQPADIIAVKGNYHTLIDCKVISTARQNFPFSRVEDNQRYAMKLFDHCALSTCWFALLLPDKRIRMLSYSTVTACESDGLKGLSGKDIEYHTFSFDTWLGWVNRWK